MALLKLDDYKDKAAELTQRYRERNEANDEYDKIDLMQWSDYPQESDRWIVPVKSPSAHNAVDGGVRLLTATRPKIKVPPQDDSVDERERADFLERYLKAVLWGASRRGQVPVEYDLTRSAFLYGEVCAQIMDLRDTVAYLRQSDTNTALADRYERLAKRAPFGIRIYHPNWVYPEYSQFGLEGVLLKYKRTVRSIRQFWGKLPASALETREVEGLKDGGEVWFYDWIDHDSRCIWIENADAPILRAEREGPLPWSCRIIQGTMLRDDERFKRQPFLFAVKESRMFDNESALLTATFSRIRAMNFNAQYKWQSDIRPDSPPRVDWTIPGGAIGMSTDENYERFKPELADDDLKFALQLTDNYIEQSTVPKQLLGSPPPREQAFATTNALAQAGKLPLVPVQVVGGWALGDICEYVLEKTRREKERVRVYGPAGEVVLKASDIPEFPVVEVTFKPDVPTDKQQLVNVILAAQQARVLSQETGMDWLGLDSPPDEKRRIESEFYEQQNMQTIATQAAAERQMLANTNQGKIEKETVNYRASDNSYEQCQGCVFFQGGGCQLVSGLIGPTDVCDLFTPNPAGVGVPGGAANAPNQGGLPPALGNPQGLTREARTQVDRGGLPVQSGDALPNLG